MFVAPLIVIFYYSGRFLLNVRELVVTRGVFLMIARNATDLFNDK